MKAKQIFIPIGIIFFLFTAFMLISMANMTSSYKEQVIEFWGDEYEGETVSSDDAIVFEYSFPSNVFIVEGGPLGNAHYFKVCKGTPLEMVPVRQVDELMFEALCGLFEPFTIEKFHFNQADIMRIDTDIQASM